jgi:SpoVK/Ycf46/Vps4 family AAA+-type ATPase
MAEEMSNTRNRGKIVWILASSRPDLIEVDLKRPGRVDVKIPLFPPPRRGRLLAHPRPVQEARPRRAEGRVRAAEGHVPNLLTPGAAETLSIKVYRQVKTENLSPQDALKAALADYQNPVPLEVMEFQIGLAVREASDLNFVPAAFRPQTKEAVSRRG